MSDAQLFLGLVIIKSQNEIWAFRRFYRPPGSRLLVFGNSIPAPLKVSFCQETKKPVDNSSAVKMAAFAGVMALASPFHAMYSRSLLLSTMRRLSVLH